jgi:hypothetical protein
MGICRPIDVDFKAGSLVCNVLVVEKEPRVLGGIELYAPTGDSNCWSMLCSDFLILAFIECQIRLVKF